MRALLPVPRPPSPGPTAGCVAGRLPGGQDAQEPVPGLPAEEVLGSQHEQRRYLLPLSRGRRGGRREPGLALSRGAACHRRVSPTRDPNDPPLPHPAAALPVSPQTPPSQGWGRGTGPPPQKKISGRREGQPSSVGYPVRDPAVTPWPLLGAPRSGAARAGPPDVDDTEAGGPLFPWAQGGERRCPPLPRRRPAGARLLHRRLPVGAPRPGAGRCRRHPGEAGSGGPGAAYPKGQPPPRPPPAGLQTPRCWGACGPPAPFCLWGSRCGKEQGLRPCGLGWGLRRYGPKSSEGARCKG